MSMFSNTLEEVMEIQEERFPGLNVPWVIIELCEAILRLRGPSTQGIFRQEVMTAWSYNTSDFILK